MPDPTVQLKDNNPDRQAGRQPATKQQVKATVEHPDAPDGLDWSDIERVLQETTMWYGQYRTYKNWVLSRAGIDGYGFEIAFEVELGTGYEGITVAPTGISVLWITNSDVSPDDVPVDPMDNPHYFLYSAVGASTGIDAGLSAGVGVSSFYADRYNGKITRGSWAGPVVSFDAEVSGSIPIGGLEGQGSYFASVDYDKTMLDGALSFGWAKSGWHGVSSWVEYEAGLEFDINVGITHVQANQSVEQHFGRPDVKEAMKNADEVPDRLKEGYNRESNWSKVVDWLTPDTNIGEAMTE